jgi:hypothetical protein
VGVSACRCVRPGRGQARACEGERNVGLRHVEYRSCPGAVQALLTREDGGAHDGRVSVVGRRKLVLLVRVDREVQLEQPVGHHGWVAVAEKLDPVVGDGPAGALLLVRRDLVGWAEVVDGARLILFREPWPAAPWPCAAGGAGCTCPARGVWLRRRRPWAWIAPRPCTGRRTGGNGVAALLVLWRCLGCAGCGGVWAPHVLGCYRPGSTVRTSTRPSTPDFHTADGGQVRWAGGRAVGPPPVARGPRGGRVRWWGLWCDAWRVARGEGGARPQCVGSSGCVAWMGGREVVWAWMGVRGAEGGPCVAGRPAGTGGASAWGV